MILAPSRDSDGLVISVLSLMIDVDEEHRAEQALRESRELYRSLVEHAAEAIIVFDVDSGVLIDANPSAERLFETLAACSAAEWAAQEFGQPNWRRARARRPSLAGRRCSSGACTTLGPDWSRSSRFEWRIFRTGSGGSCACSRWM